MLTPLFLSGGLPPDMLICQCAPAPAGLDMYATRRATGCWGISAVEKCWWKKLCAPHLCTTRRGAAAELAVVIEMQMLHN